MPPEDETPDEVNRPGEPDDVTDGEHGEPDDVTDGEHGEPDDVTDGEHGEPDDVTDGEHGEPDDVTGEPDEPDEADSEEVGTTTTSTRNRIVVGVAAAVVLVGLGWLIFGRSADETVAPTSTTTSSTTTTTEVRTRSALVSQVATAKPGVASIQVSSTPPPGWETATPVVRWDAPEIPSSQAEFTDRPALPRIDYRLQGRYATPTGWEFSSPTAFGDPLTFLVTEQRGNWAKVMIPVRPNHTEGWISLADVDLSEHDYRVELHLNDRRLIAYKGTEVIADTKVVVGKDTTRTPTGRFYVTDRVDKADPDGFYGPHVLPLNGYSEQLDKFEDGVPVIAMHGTSHPDQVGQAISNGCIRVPNEIIQQLNDRLPLGTQVEVYA